MMSHRAIVLVALASACAQPRASVPPVASPDPPSLRAAFDGVFLMGAALNADQFHERDTAAVSLIRRHFNSITPENVLKWEHVHPEPGRFDFTDSDRFVAFGAANDMFIVGHTLVWHSQTPRWVFHDADGNRVSRDTLLARMREHIHTVVGRYRGRIRGWDVVNEALNEDGTGRRTPWLEIIGEDYIAKAFQFAREADPSAELYYNDYSVENAPKRAGAVRIVKQLQTEGITVHGVGLQGHNRMDWPSVAQQDSTIAAFAALGVKVMITELDIDVLPTAQGVSGADVSQRSELRDRLNPFATAIPDSVLAAQARRYRDLFAVYVKYRDVISRVTFWGLRDGDSWLNDWPVRGRTSHPLLFDRQGRPKPAFEAILEVLRRPVIS